MLRTNINFLAHIEQLHKEQFADEITRKKYPAGSYILTQDERSNKVQIIKEGFVKCFITEENGKNFIVEFLGRGEILGDIEAIRDIKCLCNVEAVTEVDVYLFSIDFFKSVMKNDLQFNRLVIEELAERVVNTSSRASLQQLYGIKHELTQLLILQKKQDIKIPKADMAAYLGIDVRSLNRVLKTMKETG